MKKKEKRRKKKKRLRWWCCGAIKFGIEVLLLPLVHHRGAKNAKVKSNRLFIYKTRKIGCYLSN